MNLVDAERALKVRTNADSLGIGIVQLSLDIFR